MDEWEKQEQEREFLEIWRDLDETERAKYKRELYRLFNNECISRGEFSLCLKGNEFNAILN